MVKILHTSDWHIGKAIRGRSRADEHRRVLAEIAGIVDAERVDAVIVAGDVFDAATPKPESEEIAYRALLDIADTGADVVVVAGNHDSAHRLRAVAPLLARSRVHVLTEPAKPSDGGVRRLDTRGGALDVVMLPFVSQRGIVRAEQLMAGAAHEHAQAYAERLAGLVGLLCAGLDPTTPSVLVGHAYVLGAQAGGGERAAHLVEEYAVPATAFPANLGYVALGHLHRAQKLPGATQIHYCGSPLQLDFGGTSDAKQVKVAQLAAGVPAKVDAIELREGSALHTVAGTIDQIVESLAGVDESSWLRARVDEPRRAGLADELREHLGDRAERLVHIEVVGTVDESRHEVARSEGQTPHELFEEYLRIRDVSDPRLATLFDELHDAVVSGEEDEAR